MRLRDRHLLHRFTWLLVACFAGPAHIAHAVDTPNWDRATAVAAARSVDGSAVQQTLMELTIAGSTVELLELLMETGSRLDWPLPARESVLFDYTQQLRKLPAGTVPHEAMTFLKSFASGTRVPHEDHASVGVPLFNIRAAAIGVENDWLREAALLEGLALVAANPRALVDVFLIETHPAARGGYLDTLPQATTDQLLGVSKSAAHRLRNQVELTPLAGRAALLSGDLEALAAVFTLGSGPALAPLMRDAAVVLGVADSALLMSDAIEHAPAENAALAIAELGPAAVRDASGQAMLLSRLEDPDLGAAAALTLARHGTPDALQTLEKAAASGPPLTASRASTALAMSRLEPDREIRP